MQGRVQARETQVDAIHTFLTELQHLADTTWFHIGSTPVTPLRIVGLIIILSAVWWLGKLVERALLRFARGEVGARFSPSAVYALTRLTRYTIWIVGSILGLNFIGFDLASLALFGGAVGVGIGFGLQNIFSNFISGIIL
jgi:small-conductance mechanosensitive channel